MNRFLKSISFLLFSISLGVYYYTTGFFLTRFEIKEKATIYTNQPPPQFERAVLLLVDALRFDFVFPNNRTSASYANQLPAIQEAVKNSPHQAFLSEFIADPPTVTMQRIKGLTTGSLPTFIDMKDNFHSTQIEEDNLLYQLSLSGKQAIFMGDDTWVGLFSKAFKRAFPFDSFNVRDLHTVDEGVIKHMTEEMTKQDWSLMIGHMLGVDHVGHRYYANHPEMKRKLAQVNDFIQFLMDTMDQDTLLLVFGDHGMTEDGNHGGTSKQETHSALFAYTKKTFDTYGAQSPFGEKDRKIAQIDIVPTLSLLLGAGIPFNNLGAVIPELFVNGGFLEEAIYVNALQILKYLKTYDQTVKKLPDVAFEELLYQFSVLEKKQSQGETDVKGFFRFITQASEMCRSIWTNFDTYYMATGCTVLVINLISLVLSLIFPMEYKRLEAVCIVLLFVSLLSPVAGSAIWFLYTITSVQMFGKPSKDLLVVLLLEICHGYCLFSDSYIVKEHSVIRFLQLVLIFYCYMQHKRLPYSLVCAVCVRLTASTDIITQNENQGSLAILDDIIMNPLLTTYLPLLFIGAYEVYKRRLPSIRRWLFTGNLLLVFVYWLFQDLGILAADSVWIKSYIPRVVYVLSLCSAVSVDVSKVFMGILPSMILVMGYQQPIVILAALVQRHSFNKISISQTVNGLFSALMVSQYFFATGHRCTFTSLQIFAAFIGFEEFNYYVSGVLLILNTFGSVLFLLSVFGKANEDLVKIVMGYFIVNVVLTTLNTAVNRRSLMVWPIFAPKYVFEVCLSALVCVICLIFLLVSSLKEKEKK